MHPTELNAALAAITNHLYCNLNREQFVNVGIFLSLLSKDILSMAALEGLCKREEKHDRKDSKHVGQDRDNREKKDPPKKE